MMLSAGNGFIMQSEKYSRDNAGQSLKKYILLRQGELAYNHGASKAKQFGCCYELTEPEARIPYVYHCFKINEAEYTPYVALALNNPKMDRQLKRLVSSSVRMDGLLNISFDDYMSVILHLPSYTEQERTADFLKKLDGRIAIQEKLLASLKKYKRGLLYSFFANTSSWHGVKIRELGIVITGSTPLTSNPNNYTGNGLFCAPGDLGKSKYISSTEKHISQDALNKNRKIPKGSILVTCIGSTIGKMGIANTEMLTNQQINSLIVSEEYCGEFIYYALQYYFPQFLSCVGKQAVPILSKGQFEDLQVCLPTFDAQQKYAGVLSVLDTKIEQEICLLECMQRQRNGLMQQLYI